MDEVAGARPLGRHYVGTSGFAYPGWSPAFYGPRIRRPPRGGAVAGRAEATAGPPGSAAGPVGPAAGPVGPAMLTEYSRRLGAVELNSTFYRRPSAAAVDAWLAATPVDFRFCPKAQRGAAFSALRGADAAAAVAWLTEPLARFGPRLGVVLLALPRVIPRDDGALARLLEAWPPGLPLALELAHPSWMDDAVLGRLREHGAALVATDLDEAPEPDLRRLGASLYVRLRRARYDDARLATWAARLRPFLADGMDAFVFLRHDADGSNALLAERLAALLAAGDDGSERGHRAGRTA